MLRIIDTVESSSKAQPIAVKPVANLSGSISENVVRALAISCNETTRTPTIASVLRFTLTPLRSLVIPASSSKAIPKALRLLCSSSALILDSGSRASTIFRSALVMTYRPIDDLKASLDDPTSLRNIPISKNKAPIADNDLNMSPPEKLESCSIVPTRLLMAIDTMRRLVIDVISPLPPKSDIVLLKDDRLMLSMANKPAMAVRAAGSLAVSSSVRVRIDEASMVIATATNTNCPIFMAPVNA